VARGAETGGAIAMSRELSVDDYWLEGVSVFDAHTGLAASGKYFFARLWGILFCVFIPFFIDCGFRLQGQGLARWL
jgi:hypothetical protein